MEHALNECIRLALNLDFAQGLIVTKNLQFRNKQKILRVLINETFQDSEKKSSYERTAIDIGNMSDDRNMIAHDWFGPDEKGDGVSFLVTKANAKLVFPEVRWSILDFAERHNQLMEAAQQLKRMEPMFQLSDAFKALFSGQSAPPNPEPFSQGIGLLGALLSPSDQDYSPPSTTQSIDPQTPEDPST
ncbi:hypothetical protein H9Q09_04950 [Aurantimonas sp. DM33-3]|uniref:hypothetical protein n=1 Tax=Aurantimonas sp. DM33-3 TaxID=2766955 RepID=UPI001651CE25|nr:hypothetical protein [Aurantimonas sp. DM33-3]MBC6715540.1 hypothetical protein [Aurantimonas sp. DM33-3]